MENVKFMKGLSTELSNLPINNGTLIITTDDGKLYLDTDGERKTIGGGDSGMVSEKLVCNVNLASQIVSENTAKTFTFTLDQRCDFIKLYSNDLSESINIANGYSFQMYGVYEYITLNDTTITIYADNRNSNSRYTTSSYFVEGYIYV